MDLRPRITNCTHLTLSQVKQCVSEYRRGRFELGGQHGAAVQYYLRHFMYLPFSVIAEVFSRKPWHVRQTIERMEVTASESRTPVTMNEDYQQYIELFDDYCREKYGLKNIELCSTTNYLEKDYLLWQAQKAVGRYEDCETGDSQFEAWARVLSFLSVDCTEEVLYDLCDMYTISSNA